MEYLNKTTVYTAAEIVGIYNGAAATFKKCVKLEADGFLFIPGNAPFLNESKKWQGYTLIRVAQTNHRKHGRSIQTLWAVKCP